MEVRVSQPQKITDEAIDPVVGKPAPPLLGQTVSLEELAAQQGVTPVSSLDEVGSLWPVDDDPDRLLSYLISERRARRDRAEQR